MTEDKFRGSMFAAPALAVSLLVCDVVYCLSSVSFEVLCARVLTDLTYYFGGLSKPLLCLGI